MKSINDKTVETIRLLAADSVEKANSGHPGLPMGCATMAYCLWKNFLNGSAIDPNWINRDRFILSAGHGSMLAYALLHLFGYNVSLDDLKNFRQLGSITPGHPEYGVTPGIETTTGPLGQGISNAVGMAIAERHLAEKFNVEGYNIIDHKTYVIVGDGDLMEGISSESCSLAGHLKLGKLIVLYDDNSITIDGGTDCSFTEDVGKRFEAYGWEVLSVEDGNDFLKIEETLNKASLDDSKPTLIKVKTIIGFGSPNKSGTSGVHGSPLGSDELKLTKKLMGWNPDKSFVVPSEVKSELENLIENREKKRIAWEDKLEKYFEKFPGKKEKWKIYFSKELPKALIEDDMIWKEFNIKEASRVSGGRMINTIKKYLPNLIGGSADLNASTKTYLKDFGDFNYKNPSGSNIFFGVREHGMGAILNGISLHGGFRVFGSTFLVFSDYMKPAIRLSALMNQPVIYVFTHDSIGVGEDGPTHQPIEHFMMLRGIPNVSVFRPADGKETAIAWIEAIKRVDGPSVLILSRQNLPVLEGVNEDAKFGAYILVKEEKEHPEVILIASGSEVNLAVEAAKLLKELSIEVRVVSMLCFESFNRQDEVYKNKILPPNVRNRVAIETGISMGWEKYTGLDGLIIAMDRFGESAPGDLLMNEFGYTPRKIADRVIKYLST